MKTFAIILMILSGPVGWGLLGFLMYRKHSEKTAVVDDTQRELAIIREELGALHESITDVLLEVSDLRKSSLPPDTDRR